MKKRFLSMLLALCVVLALLPVSALAADGDFTIENGVLTKYNGNGGDVVIPDGVTSIGERAFYECRDLTNVIIPDSVTRIGTNAFCFCTSLTSVTIPDSVTNIGNYAFFGCTSLTSITIPKSVTGIGELAFSACSGLTSAGPIGSGSSIEFGWTDEIPRNAFASALMSVILPNGITNIGDRAFYELRNLTDVTIPDSVTHIRTSAFWNCFSLTNVYYGGSEEEWKGINIGSYNDSLTSATIHYNSTAPSEPTQTGNNSSTANTWQGHSYEVFSDQASTWDEAKAYCESLGGHLATISCQEENDFIFQLVIDAGCTSAYFGLTDRDREGTWAWITGEPVSYTNWHSGEPNSENANEDYAMFYYKFTDGTWNDGDFGNNTVNGGRTFICEWDISDYIYNSEDPGEDLILPVEKLETVTNPTAASSAVTALTTTMTAEQKASATGVDLATLYAETAVSKAASKAVSGKEIIINKAAVSDLETIAAQTSSAVETALVNGGVTAARLVSNTVALTTDETGEITIKIDPDILTTQVDKIRVETPTYALTIKVDDLKDDLTQIVTITAQDVGSGFAAGDKNKKTTVKVNLPKGKITNPVTLSLPTDESDVTYQAVVKTDGSATSSKYNPATTTMDGKINTSGSYTVQTNEKDFTDIASKSAEMQKAIRYLASKGIINGTSDTTFSPDGSISRAEIAALLVRALGKLDNSATNSFTDVKTSDWFYSAAGSSQRCKLINGYPDGTFQGGATITKDQILAVSARVLKTEMGYKEPSNAASYLSKYSDEVAQWAQLEVALATKENLVVYRVDGTFKGAGSMTRGDAAIIIYRLFQKIW